ncbi:hypothetical protein GA0070604_6162 [Micromonospora eburnea]|uniref:Uncharacterized protein n=1 Tax=Micromonospora eburnea TaxID=227316 RepID=A0A1C6VNS2_9ACTN|nr:hypothetical protein GA0070604_6162 [Micromonospora eburnea]
MLRAPFASLVTESAVRGAPGGAAGARSTIPAPKWCRVGRVAPHPPDAAGPPGATPYAARTGGGRAAVARTDVVRAAVFRRSLALRFAPIGVTCKPQHRGEGAR